MRATSTTFDALALRAARNRAQLSQHELGVLVGVSGAGQVWRWESGTAEPRAKSIRKLAEVLGLQTRELLRQPEAGPDLRWLRLVRGMSAQEVATATSASKEAYLRWESGRWTRPPSQRALQRLGEALGVTLEEVTEALKRSRP